MSLDVEGYENIAMQTFPFHTHSIKVMTVERPGETLHRILIAKGMCVSHNQASWVDLFYINCTLWNGSFVRPAACLIKKQKLPTFMKPSDICRKSFIRSKILINIFERFTTYVLRVFTVWKQHKTCLSIFFCAQMKLGFVP